VNGLEDDAGQVEQEIRIPSRTVRMALGNKQKVHNQFQVLIAIIFWIEGGHHRTIAYCSVPPHPLHRGRDSGLTHSLIHSLVVWFGVVWCGVIRCGAAGMEIVRADRPIARLTRMVFQATAPSFGRKRDRKPIVSLRSRRCKRHRLLCSVFTIARGKIGLSIEFDSGCAAEGTKRIPIPVVAFLGAMACL